MLDQTQTCTWVKWNNNGGFVLGENNAPCQLPVEQAAEPPAGAIEFAAACKMTFAIPEGSSEEEDDDESDTEETSSLPCTPASVSDPVLDHILHQFKTESMVCDLQGVFNPNISPAVFEMTDPVIHWDSGKGRKHVFGRTDKGHAGIVTFFRTHKCNALCRLLGIATKGRPR
jgi:hypothetical protein